MSDLEKTDNLMSDMGQRLDGATKGFTIGNTSLQYQYSANTFSYTFREGAKYMLLFW